MLTEERRKQLDGIVGQMVNNKESDSNIRFVVDDFKQKYQGESAVQAPTQPKKDLLQKTGDIVNKIFPGEKIGEAIGTQIAKSRVAPEARQFVEPGPTGSQIAGDVASVALNIAGVKGAGMVGSLGKRILKMAGLGAGISGAETIKEGGDIKEAAGSAIGGGIISGALPVAGAGLRAIGRQIEQLPARFVNSALGRKKAQVLQDIAKDNVDDFSKYVLKSKPIGSANKLAGESIEHVEKLGGEIETSLTSAIRQSGSKVTIGRNNLLDDIAKLPEAEGALLKRNDIKAVIERLAPQTKKLLQKESLNLLEANKLRQLVDRTLGDRAFLGSQLSSDKAVLKSFANTLRETVKSKAPEGTRELFKELTNEIRFRDALLDKIAKRAGNQVISFGDLIGAGIGSVGGVPGALTGMATRRAIESVPFKIGAAKFTNALTKLEPVINGLAPAQQTAILNFFAEVFSQEQDRQGN